MSKTVDEIKKELEAFGVELVEYGGRTDVDSTLICPFCKKEWRTRVSRVLHSNAKSCRSCAMKNVYQQKKEVEPKVARRETDLEPFVPCDSEGFYRFREMRKTAKAMIEATEDRFVKRYWQMKLAFAEAMIKAGRK